MRAIVMCAAGLAVAGLGAASLAAPAAKTAPARDVQDFVYLGDKEPVLIRLHVQIDGKPLLDVWEDFMGNLFAYLDVDGDGVLNKEEAARVPSVQTLFNNGPAALVQRRPAGSRAPAIGKDANGKVTREELADWYRKNGAAPFQFRGGNAPGTNQFVVVQLAGQPQPLSANALNEKLFSLLDANKDGKLSREELTRATASLHKLDLDDDEMVSVQEMSGNVESPVEGKAVISAAFKVDASDDRGPFALVAPSGVDEKLAQRLMDHYGPKYKDFIPGAPDLEFRIRLGGNADKVPAVEMISPKERKTPLAQAVRPNADGTVRMEFGTTQIQLGRGDFSTDPQFARNLRQQYLAQFRMADRDNNGYLDKKEANQNPLYRGLFAQIDRDGDGKLYEKELVAYLDKMKELQAAALRSCASLAVKDEGRGLFDLVDSNSDGRLGVRELRRMVQLIEQLDRDGDGQISRNEIPHKYRVDVRRGPANGNQFTPRVVALRRLGTNEPPLPDRKAGPRWFRKMDRNHDGDVSRREFLGTDDEFRRMDADGDGLISTEEAERADKLFRKDKP